MPPPELLTWPRASARSRHRGGGTSPDPSPCPDGPVGVAFLPRPRTSGYCREGGSHRAYSGGVRTSSVNGQAVSTGLHGYLRRLHVLPVTQCDARPGLADRTETGHRPRCAHLWPRAPLWPRSPPHSAVAPGGGVGAPEAPSVSCGTPFSATWRGRLARCYVILAGAEDRRPGQTARGHMTTARVRTGPTLTPAPCPCHR